MSCAGHTRHRHATYYFINDEAREEDRERARKCRRAYKDAVAYLRGKGWVKGTDLAEAIGTNSGVLGTVAYTHRSVIETRNNDSKTPYWYRLHPSFTGEDSAERELDERARKQAKSLYELGYRL